MKRMTILLLCLALLVVQIAILGTTLYILCLEGRSNPASLRKIALKCRQIHSKLHLPAF